MITIIFKALFYSLARISFNLGLNSICLDIFRYIFCHIILFCIKSGLFLGAGPLQLHKFPFLLDLLYDIIDK